VSDKKRIEQLVIGCALSIDGVAYPKGTVVGTREGDKVTSTHDAITRGHIQARLMDGRVIAREIEDPEAKKKADAEAKK